MSLAVHHDRIRDVARPIPDVYDVDRGADFAGDAQSESERGARTNRVIDRRENVLVEHVDVEAVANPDPTPAGASKPNARKLRTGAPGLRKFCARPRLSSAPAQENC